MADISKLQVRAPLFAGAACLGMNTDIFFTGETRIAKTVCEMCPVQRPCLEWAIAYEPFGVWGGTDEYERRAIRRDRRLGHAGGHGQAAG